ncbi:MAG: TraR/DksA family transcriptional regulator [Chloroflexi bacterium]|nr:MAG: TraR/DksA family transcriptional regulator [Chloroflexota bacterium]
MSRGFRDADETQAMSDQAVANEIQRILERGRAAFAGAAADGLCHDCGERIGAERLAALPSAVRCVGCQAAWEQVQTGT